MQKPPAEPDEDIASRASERRKQNAFDAPDGYSGQDYHVDREAAEGKRHPRGEVNADADGSSNDDATVFPPENGRRAYFDPKTGEVHGSGSGAGGGNAGEDFDNDPQAGSGSARVASDRLKAPKAAMPLSANREGPPRPHRLNYSEILETMMSDKRPMQADGGGRKGRPGDHAGEKVGAGESGGGPYPNPHTGKNRQAFDGGQSDKEYSGPDNPNATTK